MEYSHSLLRPLLGPSHGDCHASNLIVATGYDGTVRDIAFIDLSFFNEIGSIFCDPAYLELATLLHQMDAIGQERWLDLARFMANGDGALNKLEHIERAWATDLTCGRKHLQELAAQQYKDRLDDLTTQMLLGHITTGLAFLHKKPRQQSGSIGLSPDQYRQAFVWAALHLRRFLESSQGDWKPAGSHLISIGLQQTAEAATSRGDWRELVRFDTSGFNILFLSPLARTAHVTALKDILRLPWNLIIDLGTGLLSVEHASIRQGSTRQAWPLRTVPDLSVLQRGSLWYFANGRTDLGDVPPATGSREWRQTYLPPLQGLLAGIAQGIAPRNVRSLVLGDDLSTDFFRPIAEALDTHLGNVSQDILVATTAVAPLSDVPMQCIPLEEVCHALQAVQDPVGTDSTSAVLLPHRSELGVRLAPVNIEFTERTERDLQLVHRGLAESFSQARLFGTDFRRGQLIEWSELDRNLDVERLAFPRLLSKIRHELGKSTNATVNLLHEPSAGGTTISRRIAWTIMEEYPTVLLVQSSRNTPEYLAEIFQECGLPLLVIMEAEAVTESEREMLFRQLLDSNTRAVFLWVTRIYDNIASPEVLRAELDDSEAESFRVAYSRDSTPSRQQALDRLTREPLQRDQRSPFFYGLAAFEEGYLGLDRLVDEIVEPLGPTERELVGDLALVSSYCSEGFPAAEYDELCRSLENGCRPFPELSPFSVDLGQYIKIPHRLIAARTLRLLARLPDRWEADLGRFALSLLHRLRALKHRESDRLKQMVTAVFVTRDTTALLTADTEILAGGIPRQRRFAPLIHDLQSPEVARQVLKRVFNEWPTEPHFAVHYARHLLYEEPREIEQARQVAEISRKTELGRSNDTVVHTLGMCYRIQMESTLKLARETHTSFFAIEAALESESGSALECFTLAAALDPISEYGHLSSIQTVSTLLRGATDLAGVDLAELLADRRQLWLATALDRAESSINNLQSRPGARLSIRSRRIIAEWGMVYGQVEKVIQRLRALSEGVQDPGVRRALCSALLTKYDRKWISVADGDLQTITRLMERNIESSDFSDADLSRWLRAARLRRGFQIDKAIERLVDWSKLRPEAVEPAFYLYVFYFIQWLNSGRTNHGYLGAVEKWLEVCRANRPLGNKQWSHEWLVERDGRFDALHFADLTFDPVQVMIGRSPEQVPKLKALAPLEGTLVKYVAPQHAWVDLAQGFKVHIVPRNEIVRDHEGRRLRMFISFSYDGVIGWNPTLI